MSPFTVCPLWPTAARANEQPSPYANTVLSVRYRGAGLKRDAVCSLSRAYRTWLGPQAFDDGMLHHRRHSDFPIKQELDFLVWVRFRWQFSEILGRISVRIHYQLDNIVRVRGLHATPSSGCARSNHHLVGNLSFSVTESLGFQTFASARPEPSGCQ